MMRSVTTTSILFISFISRASCLSIVNPSTIQSIHEASSSLQHIFDHSSTIISSSVGTTGNLSNLLDLYKGTLSAHPLATKMVTGGTLAVTGDAIAQSRDIDGEYNTRRAASFMVFDMCYRALQHVSFPVIVQQCQGQYIGGVIASVPILTTLFNGLNVDNPVYYYGAMEQTLASQLGIVPFMYYPVFYVLTAFVQGLSTEGAIERAKETFIPLMKRNLLFWIPVQFIQFGFIEETLQIPFLAVCGLVWTFIISLFAGNAKKSYSSENNEITSEDVKAVETLILDEASKTKGGSKSAGKEAMIR